MPYMPENILDFATKDMSKIP